MMTTTRKRLGRPPLPVGRSPTSRCGESRQGVTGPAAGSVTTTARCAMSFALVQASPQRGGTSRL